MGTAKTRMLRQVALIFLAFAIRVIWVCAQKIVSVPLALQLLRIDSTRKRSQMPTPQPKVSLTMSTVADLQDSLLMVMNDLERLGGLLDHATENLMDRFSAANKALSQMGPTGAPGLPTVRSELQLAVTELQFHDMASQLLVHTDRILKACAYKLAEEAMGLDEDEEQGAPIDVQPRKPNPVTQSEMDAGSIELF